VETQRSPFDVESLVRRSTSGQCFICEYLRGEPGYEHIAICETDTAVAFLSRYPTMPGYVIVAPRDHLEQVTGDFSLVAYLALQQFIYKVAEALRRVLAPERVYILSLGSQAANAHVHWHIAPLPKGVPLERQQYHALMHEHGVVKMSNDDQVEIANRLRTAINNAA